MFFLIHTTKQDRVLTVFKKYDISEKKRIVIINIDMIETVSKFKMIV